MSKETVNAFYEALKADPAMAEALQKLSATVSTPHDAAAALVQFAAEKGYAFTVDDLKAFEMSAQELSEKDAETVNAAGNGAFCIFIGIGTGKGDMGICKIFGVGLAGFGFD